MHRQPSKKKLEALVERFNRDFPVGTEVILRKDSGEVRTRISSQAYMLGGHSPVAHFDGVSGAYSIEDSRVRMTQIGDFMGELQRRPAADMSIGSDSIT